jgi:hypothetical protein
LNNDKFNQLKNLPDDSSRLAILLLLILKKKKKFDIMPWIYQLANSINVLRAIKPLAYSMVSEKMAALSWNTNLSNLAISLQPQKPFI